MSLSADLDNALHRTEIHQHRHELSRLANMFSKESLQEMREAFNKTDTSGYSDYQVASGMAAVTTLLESLPAGARIVIPDDCYAGVRMLATEFLPERGVSVQRVDMADLAAVEAACATGIDLLWVETPSNPLMKLSDIAALATLAHRHGALLACDNTFASPVLQQPLALGADIVMHSTTKYFGGHSDVLGGA